MGERKGCMPVCVRFDREVGMKQRTKSELQGVPSLEEDEEEEAKEEGGPVSAAVHRRGGRERRGARGRRGTPCQQ